MGKKIIAINGSYRKGRIGEQFIDVFLLRAVREGAEVEKINLIDKKIKFCTNCRKCAGQDKSKRFGDCVLDDDMGEIIGKIEAAEAVILVSPVNFGTVTAVMKVFVERLICYSYWPWDKAIPSARIKSKDKKAVIFTSASAPSWFAKVFMRSSMSVLKMAANLVGAKVVEKIYFGSVCAEQNQKLNLKQVLSAKKAADRLLS